MANWLPVTEARLLQLLEEAAAAMPPAVERFWHLIRIGPVKWDLPPWGDEGGGFWVVAILGHACVWYNDIEDGFNVSPFEVPGRIGEYWCSQGQLGPIVQGFYDQYVEWGGDPRVGQADPAEDFRPPA